MVTLRTARTLPGLAWIRLVELAAAATASPRRRVLQSFSRQHGTGSAVAQRGAEELFSVGLTQLRKRIPGPQSNKQTMLEHPVHQRGYEFGTRFFEIRQDEIESMVLDI